MIFWFFLYILTFLFSLVSKNRIYLVWFVIWLITVFRYKVGTDYMGYVELYNTFGSQYFNTHYESDIGLMSLMTFFHSIGGTPQILFFTYGSLTCYFFYKAFHFYARGNNVLEMIFVNLYMGFLFFQTLNIIRFMLAAAIIFYSTKYIVKKKPIKYLAYISFAAIFHFTAILFLPLYLIRYLKVGRWTLFVFVLIIACIVIIHPTEDVLLRMLNLNSQYSYYLTNEKYVNLQVSTFGILNTVLYTIIAFIIYKYFRHDRLLSIIFLFYLTFIISRFLAIDIYIFQRISQYFKPFLIVGLGYAILNLKLRNIAKTLIIFLLIFTVHIGALLGLYLRNPVQKRFYSQYAINIGLLGKSIPIQIYGDYNTLPDYWE